MGFKLKSGNTSSFKNMGSSPMKQDSPKDFNVKGSKGSTTPGYSTTKAAKTQNFRDAANKIKTVSSKTNIGKTVVSSKLKDVATKVLKIGGKLVGGLGVAGTLYDMYKSGQKHSGGKAVKGQKPFLADAKNRKSTKSSANKGFNFNKGKKK